MPMRTVTSEAVPEAPQLFTNTKLVGDRLFISGMQAGDGDFGIIFMATPIDAATWACFV